MRWSEFRSAEPEMAALGEMLIGKYGIAYLGTLRPDGGPRIAPLSPAILDDRLCIGVMPATPKCKDLLRDDRCTLHALPGPDDAEFAVTGRAEQAAPDIVDHLFRSAPPHVRLARDTILFEISISHATTTRFANVGNDKRPQPTRRSWNAPEPTR